MIVEVCSDNSSEQDYSDEQMVDAKRKMKPIPIKKESTQSHKSGQSVTVKMHPSLDQMIEPDTSKSQRYEKMQID